MTTYTVSITGLSDDVAPADAKRKLALLFKASAAQIEFILASPGYVIKRGLPFDQAERYKNAIVGAGGRCTVDKEGAPPTLGLQPTASVVSPVAMVASSPQATLRHETSSPQGFFGDMANHVTDIAGVGKLDRFSVSDLFAETFKKHDADEIENFFTVGTRNTTPPILSLSVNWPQPWMFMRALMFSAILYGSFYFLWNTFQNTNLIPGLILTGSFAVPIATLVFFFEMNAPRNVSLYQILKLLLLGGVASLAISLLLFDVTSLDSVFGASAAGLVEESGKLLALFWLAGRANSERYRFTLNGLLFGAAVGTGFAAFESAGYAFRMGMNYSLEAMFDNIVLRGLLAPAGHIVWTALAGAALWKVKGARKLDWNMLTNAEFVRVFALVVGLHFVWNLPFELPFLAKYLVLGFVAWAAALAFIQHGLSEIRNEQIRSAGHDSPPQNEFGGAGSLPARTA